MATLVELCELLYNGLPARSMKAPDSAMSGVGGLVALAGLLRMRLGVERGRLGVVVCLIFEAFVAVVHAIVGASTPEPRTVEKRGFSTGKTR